MSAQAPATNPQSAPTGSECTTLLTAFELGKSHLFYVPAKGSNDPAVFWQQVFGNKGWSFNDLDGYHKPLGETVRLNLDAESCPTAQPAITEVADALERELGATLDTRFIKAFFFSAGVGVLMMRVTTTDCPSLFERIQDREAQTQLREKRKNLVEVCRVAFLDALEKAYEKSQTLKFARPAYKPEWYLYKLEQVDRKNSENRASFSYSIFFVESGTYKEKTKSILDQVAGSRRQWITQSDAARVSYKGSEVYVDWSVALVNHPSNSRDPIELNFVIAFASWFALAQMNKNTSVFLFDAFVGMSGGRQQVTAEAIHQRNMAYKDVADASIPVRWTTRRRDLFLLEAIHRNWSSERIRQNVEERMKLLTLHYKRLDDERREAFGLKIAIFGVGLTLFALISAIADLVALANKYNDAGPLILGYSINKLAFTSSLGIPVVILLILLILALVTVRRPKSP
jgi:hypothetical protein